MKHLVFFKQCIILLLLFFLFDFLISIVLLKDLKKTFILNQNPDILINGSSMSGSGFNRQEIENLTGRHVATYIREGISVFDRYEMINHFFYLHPEGIKTVVYEVNPVLLSGIKTAENVYTHFFPFMDDKTIDNYIKGKASPKEYYIHKIIRTTRFESRSHIRIILRALGKTDNIKTNILDTTTVIPLIADKWKEEVIIKQADREIFEKTMAVISSHNSKVILVMMPMYWIKLQTFNKEGYRNLCKYFEDYCSSRDGIVFLDLNRDSLIYNAGYFSDQLHFNVYGQRKITEIISSYLIKN